MSSTPFRAIDPTTGELIEEVPLAPGAAVERALDTAVGAFAAWRARPIEGRVRPFLALAEHLRSRREPYAASMAREMGKPIAEGRAEIDKCVWLCGYYAERGVEFLADERVETDASESWISYEPLGTVLAVMPWNFPFWQVFRFAVPALIAGNVGLLKHAPSVPGCARAIEQAFAAAGIPEGVFQNLFVDEVEVSRLIADRRVAAVTLTGSVGAGRAVGGRAGAAIKPSVLELGGSDPFVVLDDADLDAAVSGAVLSRFLNAGQSCIAAKRIIVLESAYERFASAFEAAVSRLVVGDPALESTQVGPMARRDLRSVLHDQVLRSVHAGATLVRGGQLPAGPGWFYPPTILADVGPGMAAFDEELFGPVAVLVRAADEDAAVALADRTPFGLGASVWSRDAARALRVGRRLSSGHLAINGIVKSDPRLPFGGVRESGYGRELSRAGVLGFTNARSVWVG